MPTSSGRISVARERLLQTASEIFYREGIHDIGVDRILDQAEVTRSTFYRHFPGKEDLVLAYIQATDTAVRAAAHQADRSDTDKGAALRVLTSLFSREVCRPGFRGCAFINAAAEYPDPASPVHRAVIRHREWLSAAVAEAFRQAGHLEPERATRHFMMLRDGAM